MILYEIDMFKVEPGGWINLLVFEESMKKSWENFQVMQVSQDSCVIAKME